MARLTKNIRNYPVKKHRTFLMGIDTVQFLWAAAGTGASLFFLWRTWGMFSVDISMTLCLCIEAVIISVGVIKIDGMSLLGYIYRLYIKSPERFFFNSSSNLIEKDEDNKMKKKRLFSKEKAVNIPTSAQDLIPFERILENGIVQVSENEYALLLSFEDIDYKSLSIEKKESLFKQYCSMLNNLPPSVTYQEFISNQEIVKEDFFETIVPKIRADMTQSEAELFTDYGEIRKATIDAALSSHTRKRKIIALSYKLLSELDNINILEETAVVVRDALEALGSKTKRLDCMEILEIFYDYYNPFSKLKFLLPTGIFKNGKNIKSYISPSVFDFSPKTIICGDAYMRVLGMLVSNSEGQLTDDYIADLLDNPYMVTVSKLICRKDKDVAYKALKNEYATALERKGQSERENSKRGETGISYGLEADVNTIKAQIDELMRGENQLFEMLLLVTVAAETEDDLKQICALLEKKGSVSQVRLATLSCQQKQALNTTLPLAHNYFKEESNCRNKLITEAASIFVPFSTRFFFDKNGISYGKDINTGNPIVIDRTADINSNGFVLGTSGGGKSFFSKMEDLSTLAKFPNDVLWVIDPEGEYKKILTMVDGEAIKVSPSSQNKINIFDVPYSALEDGTFDIAEKIELASAIVEAMRRTALSSDELGIISSVMTEMYLPMSTLTDYTKYVSPTFTDFCNLLQKRREPQAHDLYLAIQYYLQAKDSMLVGQTNVNFDKKYTIIDISECKGVWHTVALQIILSLFNSKMIEMKKKGIRCWLKADEFHSFFVDSQGRETVQSVTFFKNCFQRGRKIGCVMQGITQNLTELLNSAQAQTMLSNSTFIVLLRQNKLDLDKIQELYHLTNAQAEFLERCGSGQGIIVCDGKIIQFDNRIPETSKVFKLCDTRQKHGN